MADIVPPETRRGTVTLWDHFSATINLRISEPQPQYGLVQLNARREACGSLISCDVNRAEFLAAVAEVLNVAITENPRMPQVWDGDDA